MLQGEMTFKQGHYLWVLTNKMGNTGCDWNSLAPANRPNKQEAHDLIDLLDSYFKGTKESPSRLIEDSIRRYFPEWELDQERLNETRKKKYIPFPIDEDNNSNTQDEKDTENIEMTEHDTPQDKMEKVLQKFKKEKFNTSDDYVKPEDFDRLASIIKAKQNVLLVGPAGCGKSRLVSEIAKSLGKDLFTISFGGGMRYAQAFGSTHITNGDTEWKPSELLQAVQKPCVVFLDEVMGVDPDIGLGLNSLLEKDTRRFLSPIGEIKVHSECSFIAASNTTGRETRNRQYTGAQRADDSLLDRFSAVYHMDYNSEVESHLVYNILNNELEHAGMLLLDMLTKLRESIKVYAIPFDPSTRRLINAANLVLLGNHPREAFELSFLNSLTHTERSKIQY